MSVIVLHLFFVIHARYYEDFKIANDISNLTQLYVEASVASVCVSMFLFFFI